MSIVKYIIFYELNKEEGIFKNMKKKKVLLGILVATSLVALASCSGGEKECRAYRTRLY